MTNKTSPTFSHSARTNILWHRRLGLSVFLLLIFLAISGFALNHSPALKLNQIALSNNWLLSWYGLEKAPAKGFQVDGQWLYHNGDAELIVDGTEAAPCRAPLLSAAANDNGLFALCADSLVMLTPQGQFVEQFSAIDGLPTALQGLAVVDNRLYLINESIAAEFDPERWSISPAPMAVDKLARSQQAMATLPQALAQQLEQHQSGPSISLETVILDLHSGRFFGQFGVLFIDLIGILICILSITGLIAWINRR